MKRALLFLAAGLSGLLLIGPLPGCGEQNIAPKSQSDQPKPEVKSEVKSEAGSIKASAPALPSPATVAVPAAEEEEEDQFGC